MSSSANTNISTTLTIIKIRSYLYTLCTCLLPLVALAQSGSEPSKIVIALNDSLYLRPEVFTVEFANDATNWRYQKGTGRTIWIASPTHIENANIRVTRVTGEVMLVRLRFNPYSKLQITDLGFTPGDTVAYMTPPSPTVSVITEPKKFTLQQIFELQPEDVLDDAIFLYTTHSSVDEAQITIYPNRVHVGDTLFIQAACEVLDADTAAINCLAAINDQTIELSLGYHTEAPPASENQDRTHWQADAILVPMRPGIYLIRDGSKHERSYHLDTGGAFIIVE